MCHLAFVGKCVTPSGDKYKGRKLLITHVVHLNCSVSFEATAFEHASYIQVNSKDRSSFGCDTIVFRVHCQDREILVTICTWLSFHSVTTNKLDRVKCQSTRDNAISGRL